MKNILSLITLSLFSTGLFAQSTSGELNFTFTTLPNDGNFSPRHVLAVWIETSEGDFVKTLKLRADRRDQYLYTWNQVSSGNTTDAITGATLSSHETHNLTWDLTDVGENVVNNGDYAARVEYTSEHAQGPLLTVNFNKSTSELSLQPSDETYFESITLTYTPESITGINKLSLDDAVGFWPNPASDFIEFNIRLEVPQKLNVDLYDANLRQVASIYSGRFPAGEKKFRWNIDRSLIKAGTYFIVVQNGKSISAQKLLILE